MPPETAAPPATTVAELLLRQADNDDRALLFEGSEWSWREVVSESQRRAGVFAELSDGGPLHLGVHLDNTDEYLFILGGAALAGAVVVGLNPTRRGEALARDVRKTDCRVVLSDLAHVGDLDGLDLGTAAGHVLAVDGEEYRSRLRRVVAAPAGDEDRVSTPEDLYLLIFTSGSTGHPKAVRMTQGRAARAGAKMPFTPADVLYCAMPLFHGNSLSSSVFPWMGGGATLALRRRFSASGFLPDVRASGATFANTVGRAIAHIVATQPTELDRDHALRFVLGPETSGPDKDEFTHRFGVPVIEGYGSSEGAIVLNPVPDARPGALGRAPKGTDIAVVDPATGEPCPTARFDGTGRLANPEEAIGELVGRTAVPAFEGYYNDPEAEALRVRDGWYWSGDLAYRADDGIFYFAGRTGDWLRVDSENFTAAPIEQILGRMDGVRGVAVYAVPDSRTGDQVMAALELEEGRAFDPGAFTAFLAAQPDLGTKWAPRYLRIVGTLPTTATHKMDKGPLRSRQWWSDDPHWQREERGTGYVRMTPADMAALRAAFLENGRADLLTG